MNTAWTIQSLLDGAWTGPLSFEDGGIVNATRSLANQAADACSLSFASPRPPLLGALPTGTIMRVSRDDFDGPGGASNPKGWFTGSVVSPQRVIAGAGENATLTLLGPWAQWLARLVYTQLGLYRVTQAQLDASAANAAALASAIRAEFGNTSVYIAPAATLQRSSTILLTQGMSSNAPMSSAGTLQDALQYALDKGARFTIGTLPDDVSIPSEQLSDVTIADMVKKVLRWSPDVVAWWDYEVDPPTINFSPRAKRPAVTLWMGGDTPQVQQAALRPRDDLILPGVTLQYLRHVTASNTASTTTTTTPAPTPANPNPQPVSTTVYNTGPALVAPSNNSGYQNTTQPSNATKTATDGSTTTTSTTGASQEIVLSQLDQAGPDPYGFGALVVSIQLQGGSLSADPGAVNTMPFEPTPQGLALQIFNSRQQLSFEGSVTLKGQEIIPLGNPLARTLNIVGGDEDWTAMEGEIQTVSESMANGSTSLSLGPPNHLGPSDLAALLNASRFRQYVDAASQLLRGGGSAGLPPQNPTPPYTPPAGGQNGGQSGPSNAPGGGFEVTNGFSGILKNFAGTKDVTNPLDGTYHNAAPLFELYGQFAPETEQPGQGAQFTARLDCNAVATPAGDQWSTHFLNNASHTEGNLDLTAFPSLQYSYAQLRGSIEVTDAETGNAHTTDYTEDCTARLGYQSFYRVYASTPAKYVYDRGNGDNGARGYAKITIDRIYLVRRSGSEGG